MTTRQIADRLVQLCRAQQYETAQRELYANDAVSLEPYATPGFAKETRGLGAIIEKGRRFLAMVETIHQAEVSDPVVGTHSFACAMRLDVTLRGQGRMNLRELCVYEIREGKIVLEQFHV